MQITFNIQYKTVFGEELLLNIASGEAGDRTIAMSTADGLTWTCQIEAKKSEKRLDYFYSVRNCCGIKCSEWKTVTHRLDLNTKASQHIIVEDCWHEIPCDTYLYSSAFTDCVNRRAEGSVKPLAYDKALRLIVRAPQLHSGARLALTGKGAVLGNWDLKKALHMTEHNHNEWIVDIDGDALDANDKEVGLGNNNKICSKLVHELEFKFVAFSDKGDEMWETCENRTLTLKPLEQNEVRVVALDQSFYALCDEKVAGTLVPVFSLRSEGSFGVGDFGDLKLMIDWVAKTHQRLLQVLPINDSTSTHTWTDSYPYSCISIFALHPQYADLRQLPALSDKLEADRFEVLREELNALPQIDYERVNNAKLSISVCCLSRRARRCLRLRSSRRSSPTASTGSCLTPTTATCATSTARASSLSGLTTSSGTRLTVRHSAIRRANYIIRWRTTTTCSSCSTSRCALLTSMPALAASSSRATYLSA